MENISSVLLKPRTVELRKSIVPEVGPEDVCVQVQVTGLCGSDVRLWLLRHTRPADVGGLFIAP